MTSRWASQEGASHAKGKGTDGGGCLTDQSSSPTVAHAVLLAYFVHLVCKRALFDYDSLMRSASCPQEPRTDARTPAGLDSLATASGRKKCGSDFVHLQGSHVARQSCLQLVGHVARRFKPL